MAADPHITITPADHDRWQVHIDGELFTVHCPRDADRPFFYPLLGPGGVPLTRRWPVETAAAGEKEDHRHHRGLWYAHGAVNGHDFWTEGRGPKIVQTRAAVEQDTALVTQNDWISPAGDTVCTDRRVHRFSAGNGYRQIDIEITLVASHGRLVIGDTKEGSLAIRVPATMRVKGEVAEGHLVTSEGKRDAAAWGTRADWCASVGPVGDKTFSIAILDHPSNPRHPTWWHARDYGLLAANAFGQHDFEKKPKGSGDLVIEPDQSVSFRYRVVLHEGDENAAGIADHYRRFTDE